MKPWPQPLSLLRNDKQRIVANINPDLREAHVLAGPVDGIDVIASSVTYIMTHLTE